MVVGIIIAVFFICLTAVTIMYIRLLDHSNANKKLLDLETLKHEHEKEILQIKQTFIKASAASSDSTKDPGVALINALANLDNLWEDSYGTTKNNKEV